MTDDYRPVPIDGDPDEPAYDTWLEAANAAAIAEGWTSYEAFIESKAGAWDCWPMPKPPPYPADDEDK